MRRALLTLVAATAACLASAQSAPKVLVVQTMAPIVDEVDYNVVVRTYFGAEFESDGRVQPIVWSMSDPEFRKAIDSKTLVDPPQNPKLDEAFEAARKLGCEYLVTISALRHGDSILANAQLYKGRRQIWKDDGQFTATANSQISADDNARSIARTWVLKMGQGPLKDLPQMRVIRTPEPDPGTKPTMPNTPVNPPPQIDNAALKEEIAKRVEIGEWKGALAMTRDAVDAEPIDSERRMILVDLLFRMSRFDEARQEARRAGGLFPEDVMFWISAARCSIATGSHADAIRDLNEAVVRKPDSPETRAMLGEVQLAAGRIAFAIEHLDAAIGKSPSGWLYLLRGCAYQLLGDPNKSTQDLLLAKDGLTIVTPEQRRNSDLFAFLILSTAIETHGAEMRTLLPDARRAPKSADVKQRLSGLEAAIGRYLAVANTIEPYSSNPQSQQRAVLALRLLGQAVADIKGHLASPSEEALTDATISLGEAFKALEAARAARATGN